MRKTKLCVIACALLSSACSLTPRETVIPDQSVPHRLAKPTEATVWVRKLDGSLQQVDVEIPAGWWVASPEVVAPKTPTTLGATKP